jgi:hypothetical protein
MNQPASALRGFGYVNARRDDLAEARRVGGGLTHFGNFLASAAVPIAFAHPLAGAAVGGIGLTLSAAGQLTQLNEEAARSTTFGTKVYADEARYDYLKRQADIANRISDAAQQAGSKIKGKGIKGAPLKSVQRASVSLAGYQAKQRNARS